MSPDRNKVIQAIRPFFGDSFAGRIKALNWYNSNNPLLGGVSPKHMVQGGQADKLLSFIEQQLAEDKP